MHEELNVLSFPLMLGDQPQSSMHSSTRVESEELVDYSETSMSAGSLGDSVDEYDDDYFMPQPDSSKFFILGLTS